MKSFAAILLIAASAAATTTVTKTEHGGANYAYTVQDQPGAPYVRAYKADQYSGVPIVPVAYPGVHRPVAYASQPAAYVQGSYVQPGSYVTADRPVAYVGSQPGYQAVVPGVQPIAYAAQPGYVQPAYVPGQHAYVH